MHRTRRRLTLALLLAGPALMLHQPPRGLLSGVAELPADLEAITLNVWHGLRPEVALRLPGEDRARTERRIALQLRRLAELDPDLVLLQELNPASRLAARYAETLGYDEIHLVASCGLAVGPLGVPFNISSGLAILARRGLGLRRLRGVRLSGPPGCVGDDLGLQLHESRFALLGSLRFGGRSVLVAVAHLHAGGSGAAGLSVGIRELTGRGRLSSDEGARILEAFGRHRERRRREVGRLLAAIDRELNRQGGRYAATILGGDLNAEPDSAVLAALTSAGFAAHLPTDGQRPLPTWDPAVNSTNIGIGARPRPRLLPPDAPPELLELFQRQRGRRRTIDYLLSAGAITGSRPRIVFDSAADGLYPSDHFGVAARFSALPPADDD